MKSLSLIVKSIRIILASYELSIIEQKIILT